MRVFGAVVSDGPRSVALLMVVILVLVLVLVLIFGPGTPDKPEIW
ncbi:hypothetical protein GCM10010387_46500 [Streptomyces inusitatus]|uniref:Uncharacterized protein n=1 Tax=Streptomyces inusitatus TaxID=68221 RepID=A0A918QGY0_9ACTN|nr:hypothetical protein [Streptomyces inusitatus]GGZ46742.1 hypothetical protein GCM10010387_46500 [Streptomyces inusitatus]